MQSLQLAHTFADQPSVRKPACARRKTPQNPTSNREVLRSFFRKATKRRTQQVVSIEAYTGAHLIGLEFCFGRLQPQLIQAAVSHPQCEKQPPVPLHLNSAVDLLLCLCQRRPRGEGLCPHLHPPPHVTPCQVVRSSQAGAGCSLILYAFCQWRRVVTTLPFSLAAGKPSWSCNPMIRD